MIRKKGTKANNSTFSKKRKIDNNAKSTEQTKDHIESSGVALFSENKPVDLSSFLPVSNESRKYLFPKVESNEGTKIFCKRDIFSLFTPYIKKDDGPVIKKRKNARHTNKALGNFLRQFLSWHSKKDDGIRKTIMKSSFVQPTNSPIVNIHPNLFVKITRVKQAYR